MLFVTLRILSLIFFFVSDLLWVKPIKSGLPNYLLIFLRSIFTTITFITAWLIAQYIFYDESINYHLIEKEYPQDLVFYIEAILLCLFSFWGLYHFTASLKLNKFSFVAPLANLGFIFTILTSIAVYQINITNTQIIALVVFAITVIIILRKFQFSDFKILDRKSVV
jgi:hypothetical protein